MLSGRVSEIEPSIIREMSGKKGPKSIDLSLGQPALPPNAELIEQAFNDLKSGTQGYTSNAGLLEARQAIALHHALEGRDQADNVIITVGSEEAVFLGMIGTLDAGDEVLVPEPGYPAYRGIAKLIGAKPVSFPIERRTGLIHRALAIESKLSSRTKLIVLNCPSNPFGTVDDPAELEAIVDLAKGRGLVLLSDEIYRDLFYGERRPPSVCDRYARSILVSGLSKSCALTGHRLGYLIAEAPFVKKLALAHQLLVTCAPRLAQHAAERVFLRPELLFEQLPYYRRAREAIVLAAAELPKDAPLFLGGAAFYAILDISAYAGGDALAFALRLLEEEDVVTVPGTAFGPSGGWFLRLSYASGAEAAGEGIRRIARFLARCPGP